MSVELLTRDELLDVVDPLGEPTGQRLPKAVIHQNGLLHRDVHVWLTNGTDLLEQQRAYDKSIMPGEWDVSVGGHVAAGESYLAAAVRETSEELGLDLPASRFRSVGRLAIDMMMQPGPQQWLHRTVGEHFVVLERQLDIRSLRLQTSEVVDARMYPIDQLAVDLEDPLAAKRHASQPYVLWQLGIRAMQAAASEQ